MIPPHSASCNVHLFVCVHISKCTSALTRTSLGGVLMGCIPQGGVWGVSPTVKRLFGVSSSSACDARFPIHNKILGYNSPRKKLHAAILIPHIWHNFRNSLGVITISSVAGGAATTGESTEAKIVAVLDARG